MFTPFLPDDFQVNPGTYGAELAWWLCEKLARRGTLAEYPQSEDWAWLVDWSSNDDTYRIWCRNDPDTVERWELLIEPQPKTIFGRKAPPLEGAENLVEAIDKILAEEPAIIDINWTEE